MKRRIVMLLIFLLLGAIVNIAVAWGCSAWPLAVRQSEAPDYQPAVDVWERFAVPVPSIHAQTFPNPTTMPITRTLASAGELRAWGVRVRYAGGTTVLVDASPPYGTAVYLVSSGWPAIAFDGQRWDMQPFVDVAETQPAGVAELTRIGCIGLWSPAHSFRDGLGQFLGERLIPIRPLWPGFAINTLFYAAILWLLFAAPFALRRMRRSKRGLCPACAYPVGTSDLCTECGNKLNITSKIARERMGLPPPATPASEAERTT